MTKNVTKTANNGAATEVLPNFPKVYACLCYEGVFYTNSFDNACYIAKINNMHVAQMFCFQEEIWAQHWLYTQNLRFLYMAQGLPEGDLFMLPASIVMNNVYKQDTALLCAIQKRLDEYKAIYGGYSPGLLF